MADLFRCDHCGDVHKPHEKKGTLTLQEHDWRGGVLFPAPNTLKHDLCGKCFAKLMGAIHSARLLKS